MAESTPETENFGLTRVGPGESLAKNGHARTDLDVLMMDSLLQALVDHQHDAAPALGNPDDPPALTANQAGGSLPAGTKLYYKIALIDRFGLETAASPEASVTTSNPIAKPAAPAVTLETTGGSLAAQGRYAYVVTFDDGIGGETQASASSHAVLSTGSTNRIRLNLPALPSLATQYKIYRARPGQSQFFFLANHSGGTVFYDDGGTAEDNTIVAPTINTTMATNSVDVTLPGSVDVNDITAWVIYRTTEAGRYGNSSVVHRVVETVNPTDTTVISSWTDDGTPLSRGVPKSKSSTISGGKVVQLNQVQGQLPITSMARGNALWNTFCPGTLTDLTDYGKTRTTRDIQPAKLTAYFQTPPVGLNGATPVQVRVIVTDGTNSVTLNCDDDTGYYVEEWPLDSGTVEAEHGTRSVVGSMPILSDSNASNGEVVEMNAQNEYVEVDVGQIEAGEYSASVTIVEGPGSANPTNDFELSVRRGDDDTVIASTVVTVPNSSSYSDVTIASFQAPGDTEVILRATKVTANAATIHIDKFSYNASVTTLSKGDITCRVEFDGSPATPGGDVQVSLWF